MFETFVRRLATASAPSRKRAHGPQLLRPASLLPPIDDLAPFWLCRKPARSKLAFPCASGIFLIFHGAVDGLWPALPARREATTFFAKRSRWTVKRRLRTIVVKNSMRPDVKFGSTAATHARKYGSPHGRSGGLRSTARQWVVPNIMRPMRLRSSVYCRSQNENCGSVARRPDHR